MYFYSLNWLWCINATISCVYIWKHGGSGFYCSHHRFRLYFRICSIPVLHNLSRSCRKLVGAGPMSCILNFFLKKSDIPLFYCQHLQSICNTVSIVTVLVNKNYIALVLAAILENRWDDINQPINCPTYICIWKILIFCSILQDVKS